MSISSIQCGLALSCFLNLCMHDHNFSFIERHVSVSCLFSFEALGEALGWWFVFLLVGELQ